MWNWWRIHENRDLSYLLLTKRSLNKYENEFLSNKWKVLHDQYLKAFGLGETMEKLIEKERNLILMYEDKNVHGNRDVMTFIEIEEIEISEIRKKLMGKESDFYQIKAQLESIVKFSIDIKKCSVKEYYSYFKMLEKQNDRK